MIVSGYRRVLYHTPVPPLLLFEQKAYKAWDLQSDSTSISGQIIKQKNSLKSPEQFKTQQRQLQGLKVTKYETKHLDYNFLLCISI